MGILKDTITGIPRTAKRLGGDVGNVLANGAGMGYAPGAYKTFLPPLRQGIRDIGNAFHGRGVAPTVPIEKDTNYIFDKNSPAYQPQNTPPTQGVIPQNSVQNRPVSQQVNQVALPPQHAALQGMSQNVARALPVSGGMLGHAQDMKNYIDSLAKGGSIKKTGIYKLHKGEYVETKREAKGRALDKSKK